LLKKTRLKPRKGTRESKNQDENDLSNVGKKKGGGANT